MMARRPESMPFDAKTMARFWSKVDIRGPDECWPWTGARTGNGYGAMKIKGKMVSTHRLAAGLEEGDARFGLHSCDNEPCCNPTHLRPGSQLENRQDCVRKNRQAKGRRIRTAILSDELIPAIRGDERAAHLVGERFGISKSTVWQIRARKTWRHVPEIRT